MVQPGMEDLSCRLQAFQCSVCGRARRKVPYKDSISHMILALKTSNLVRRFDILYNKAPLSIHLCQFALVNDVSR
jgi:hypothetical protein